MCIESWVIFFVEANDKEHNRVEGHRMIGCILSLIHRYRRNLCCSWTVFVAGETTPGGHLFSGMANQRVVNALLSDESIRLVWSMKPMANSRWDMWGHNCCVYLNGTCWANLATTANHVWLNVPAVGCNTFSRARQYCFLFGQHDTLMSATND